ncbi:MAG TPA: YrrS family protein [Candidatus Pseudogracilibacillus intestinigallinarum]|uniref:YrrS family protein n=1 Tax=Candidatus Pseudogracilibacillus intestinigallinarum TaxID=2838742 RepID=A0A9D1PMG9_9BACI|nr:YrrS family protein [Candidatus Pseudogracilibacillus intestinigallinarum]
MTDPNNLSRVDRHSKRRNNRIQLIVLIVLAILCVVLLISLIFKKDSSTNDGNENDPTTENIATETNDKEQKTNEKDSTDENKDDKKDNETDDEEKDKEEAKEGIMKKEDYPTDITKEEMFTTDGNVEEAFVADWPPIGTNQTGTHTVNFDNESEDRKEIKKAISYVTDLKEDDMIEHWVGNGGDQKVIATVSNNDQSIAYKVYLQWEIDKGWKPTKVEKLKSLNIEQ